MEVQIFVRKAWFSLKYLFVSSVTMFSSWVTHSQVILNQLQKADVEMYQKLSVETYPERHKEMIV